MLLGYVSIVLLVTLLGSWGTHARIAGAIVAPGVVQLEDNRQVVQHPAGGVVTRLLARDGDTVAAGDALLHLQSIGTRDDLKLATLKLHELRARKARLEAERSGAAQIDFGNALASLARKGDEVADILAGQMALFENRRQSSHHQIAQIEMKIQRTHDQIAGAQAYLDAVRVEADLIASDLADAQALFAKGMTRRAQISTLQREHTRLDGQTGRITADIARLRGDIAGLEIEKLKIAGQRREDAISLLRDVHVQEAELLTRQNALQDQLADLTIRAPVAGVIHDSRVFASRTVIAPGAPIMFIVPQDDPLVVTARIDAARIHEVFAGQDATLRFASPDPRERADVLARVLHISADVFTDQATGLSYYQGTIVPKTGELDKPGRQKLLPGMQVDALLLTAERSPLTYLIGPMMRYFHTAFRET